MELKHYTHQRFANQGSVVSIHSNPKSEYTKSVITKYEIPPSCKEKLKNELNWLGINQTFIYPGLDSIGKQIAHEFRMLTE